MLFENYYSIEQRIKAFVDSEQSKQVPLMIVTLHPDKALRLYHCLQSEFGATALSWYLGAIGDTFYEEKNGVLVDGKEKIKYEHVFNTLKDRESTLTALDIDGIFSDRLANIRKWISLFEYGHIPTIGTICISSYRDADAELELTKLLEAHHVQVIIVQEPTYKQWKKEVDRILATNPESPLLEIRDWLEQNYRFSSYYNNHATTLYEDWHRIVAMIEEEVGFFKKSDSIEEGDVDDLYHHILGKISMESMSFEPQLKELIHEKDMPFIENYLRRIINKSE